MENLDAWADRLGVEVIHRKIRTANGLWLPEHRLIVLRSGMKRVHERTVYAHELAHATLDHWGDSPKHEMQADRYAANTLIREEDFIAATRGESYLPAIAHELGVTRQLLMVWLSYHRPGVM